MITLKSHKTVLPGRAEGETRARPQSECHSVDPTRLSEEKSKSLGFILPALFSKTNSGTSQKVYGKWSSCKIVPVFLSVRQAKRIASVDQTEIHHDTSQLTWESVGGSPGSYGDSLHISKGVRKRQKSWADHLWEAIPISSMVDSCKSQLYKLWPAVRDWGKFSRFGSKAVWQGLYLNGQISYV